jgi:hypothetical protein
MTDGEETVSSALSVDIGAQGAKHVELELRRDAAVSGRISVVGRDGTHKPLRGAKLTLQRRGRPTSQLFGDRRLGTSDENGEYKIAGLVAGQYLVSVEAPAVDGVRPRIQALMHGLAVSSTFVIDTAVAASGKTSIVVDVVMTTRAPTLRGRVVDEQGAPQRSYGVIAIPSDRQLWFADSPHIQFDVTADDGSFVFNGLSEGNYVLVVVTMLNREDVADLGDAALERMQGVGASVKLGIDETRVLDLRIAGKSLSLGGRGSGAKAAGSDMQRLPR